MDYLIQDPSLKKMNRFINSNRKILVLVSNGAERNDIHFIEKEFDKDNLQVIYASLHPGLIKIWDEDHWDNQILSRYEFLEEIRNNGEDYEAFVIPGEKMHMEKLRENTKLIGEINKLIREGRTVITIGYGIQLLIDSDSIHGRKITGPLAIRKDIENAGAKWQEQNITIDGSLITINDPKLIHQELLSPKNKKRFTNFDYLSILSLTIL